MYRTCLYCLSSLGSNQVIEAFPIGRIIACDAQRGRLWVVCPACGRWNLVPVEERWEIVETLERLWSRTSRRAQREAVGLAELDDGTRLIRIGAAGEDELATWRYGRELKRSPSPSLMQRMSRTLRSLTTGTAFAPAALGRHRTILHVTAEQRRSIPIRRSDLDGAEFTLATGDGMLRVRLPHLRPRVVSDPWRSLDTREACILLDRVLVSVNEEGATPNTLSAALRFLERRGAERLIHRLADDPAGAAENAMLRIRYHGEGAWRGEYARSAGAHYQPLPKYRTLALEMALQEEAERRALDGELAALTQRWREAEELASIADSL